MLFRQPRFSANDFIGHLPNQLHNRKATPSPSLSDEAWSAARRVARELDKILDGAGPRQAPIERAAAELRLSTRQIYNLLARYRIPRTVTSLLRATGTGLGKSALTRVSRRSS
ncbi:hypothetical protein [Mesorhizobium sp. M0408]|uniref:hypothetical protein n=1 Tax=Mesorhizobium sp. M0408 TaxID=2956942 RepID=UPI0033396DF9